MLSCDVIDRGIKKKNNKTKNKKKIFIQMRKLILHYNAMIVGGTFFNDYVSRKDIVVYNAQYNKKNC